MGESFALPGDLCRELLASSRAGERVWIRPAGSNDPSALDPLAAGSAAVEQSLLDPSAPFAGDDPALCERTRRAGCIQLTGGAYLDWYRLLTPSAKRSGLCAALLDAHRSGALLIAAGAAASFLADWAIVDRSALNRLRRNPRDTSQHTLVQGLGLVPGMIIDASGAPQGSVSRLLALSAQGPSELALFLDGPVAWITRAETLRTTDIRGSGAALVFDLHTARRQHAALCGGRLSLLGNGDRWNTREHAVPTATRALDPGAPEVRRAPSTRLPWAPLDAAALRNELAREFAPSRSTTSTFSAPHLKLSLQADSATHFGEAGGETSATRAGIAFDLFWDLPSGS